MRSASERRRPRSASVESALAKSFCGGEPARCRSSSRAMLGSRASRSACSERRASTRSSSACEDVEVRVEARLAIEERRLPALGQPLQRLLRRLEREGAARGEALGRRARVARLEEELLRLPQRIVHRERLQRAHVRLAPAALARRDRKDAPAAQRGGMGARGAGEPGGGGVLFCLGQGAAEQEAQARRWPPQAPRAAAARAPALPARAARGR